VLTGLAAAPTPAGGPALVRRPDRVRVRGLCYAEDGERRSRAGSAYTYAYATMAEFMA